MRGEKAVFYTETKEECETECSVQGGNTCMEGKHPLNDGVPSPKNKIKWACMSGEDKILYTYTKEDCLRTCWINGGDSCAEIEPL